MGKYDPLRDHLSLSPDWLEMTFDDVANLVGGLPASAYNHRAWRANSESHVEAQAWLTAGMRVEQVDLARRRVRFARGRAGFTSLLHSRRDIF